MAEAAILLRRAPVDIPDISRPQLLLRVEHGLGIAKLCLFGADADARFHALCGRVPPGAGRQIESEGMIFAWLAPGEWLVTGEETTVAAWVAQTAALGAADALVLDISHAQTAFLIEGPCARGALAAHCPLDLWPEAFPVHAIARSLLGDTGMFIARLADVEDAPRFRIIVDQTMAPYAARLLAPA